MMETAPPVPHLLCQLLHKDVCCCMPMPMPQNSSYPGWIMETQAANLHLYGCLAQAQVGLALLYTLEGGLDVSGSMVTCS